jgi:hypothetical protein
MPRLYRPAIGIHQPFCTPKRSLSSKSIQVKYMKSSDGFRHLEAVIVVFLRRVIPNRKELQKGVPNENDLLLTSLSPNAPLSCPFTRLHFF